MTRAPYLTALLLTAALTAPTAASAEPHLFIDRADIASATGVTRVTEHPDQRIGPVTGPADHVIAPYVSVEPTQHGYRMYFDSRPNLDEGGWGNRLTVKTSRDGIVWGPPMMLPFKTRWGAGVIRDDKYRYVAWTDEGIRTRTSRDGLDWQPFSAPVIPANTTLGDAIQLSKVRGQYLATVMMRGTGYQGSGPNTPEGVRRLAGLSWSSDFKTWTSPRTVFEPDAGDRGLTEFYGWGGVLERGGLLVGLLRVLRDDISEGVGYTVLVWSRDGRTWHRDREPFLSPGTGWDAAMAWADDQVTVGNRTRIYYGGYRSGHKTNYATDRQIGVASIVRDRYVAREAKAGHLTTRTVRVDGALRLNAHVRGSLTIRAAGRACHVARGDYVYRPVCQFPAGRYPVTFRMRDVSLYGFDS
jgi:hypothetical protein